MLGHLGSLNIDHLDLASQYVNLLLQFIYSVICRHLVLKEALVALHDPLNDVIDGLHDTNRDIVPFLRFLALERVLPGQISFRLHGLKLVSLRDGDLGRRLVQALADGAENDLLVFFFDVLIDVRQMVRVAVAYRISYFGRLIPVLPFVEAAHDRRLVIQYLPDGSCLAAL